MRMRGVERVFLDTNVLLAATDLARPERDAALGVLERWPREGVALYVSGQVLREYLAVATRPAKSNGLGLSPADAVANVRALRSRLQVLAEDGRQQDTLLRLVHEHDVSGKQVHDANIVAAMLAASLEVLLTLNGEDFRRYEPALQVLGVEDWALPAR